MKHVIVIGTFALGVISFGAQAQTSCGGANQPACGSAQANKNNHDYLMKNSPSYRINHNSQQREQAKDAARVGEKATPDRAQNNSHRSTVSKQ